jgi:hypothetical protein
MILIERHACRLVKTYRAYLNHARPHQGSEQRMPCRRGRLAAPSAIAALSSRPVLSGRHHDYSWLAASSAKQNQTRCSTSQ